MCNMKEINKFLQSTITKPFTGLMPSGASSFFGHINGPSWVSCFCSHGARKRLTLFIDCLMSLQHIMSIAARVSDEVHSSVIPSLKAFISQIDELRTSMLNFRVQCTAPE